MIETSVSFVRIQEQTELVFSILGETERDASFMNCPTDQK